MRIREVMMAAASVLAGCGGYMEQPLRSSSTLPMASAPTAVEGPSRTSATPDGGASAQECTETDDTIETIRRYHARRWALRLAFYRGSYARNVLCFEPLPP